MPAQGQRDFTIGVEEEYQLVSAETGQLRSRARHVLEIDWSAEIKGELQETMLETGTHICATAEELDREIRRLRLQVASAAASQDLRMVAAGLHPFSSWQEQHLSEGERYTRIQERFGRIVRTIHVFGMHIHVAVPEGVDRIHVQNQVRWLTPYLLALSCSSPVYEGEDTGYASYRAIVWRRLPLTGPVPTFGSEREYRDFVQLLIRSGAALDRGTIYWSLRPHPEYPTLEFRIADVCPRVEDAVAIAALARAYVAATVEGRWSSPATGFGATADSTVLNTNEWLAARFGLEAELADPRRPGESEPVRDTLQRLVHELQPVAESLGDGEALEGVRRILERGNAADRIRQLRPKCDDLAELVEWLAEESVLGTGLDRRMEQRGEVCTDGPAGALDTGLRGEDMQGAL